MTTPVTRPPIPGGWKYLAIFVTGALVGALSAVQVVPNFTGALGTGGPGVAGALDSATGEVVTTEGSGAKGKGPGAGPAGSAKASSATASSATGGALAPSRPGLECTAGKNGGSTDQGVSGSEVSMATTVAESGPGAAFLGEVRYAMEAVRQRVNRAGGICGRTLEIQYVDDGWDAQRGAQYLRNFIQQKVFAIPVGPSSEGLNIVINSGDIDRARIPVVGTDGMLENQYVRPDGAAQPWVWPVAAATVSSARIMCQNAYKRGARRFSIVFDSNYRFGVEGAEAFNACVRRLTGKDVPGYNKDHACQKSFCGIIANRSSYSSEAATFEEGDFVALFVEPTTGLAWMNDPNVREPSRIKYGYGGAQPLFTRSFAVNCQSKCDGMQVWTGFKPPIEGYANDAAVRAYVQALKSTRPSADEFNAFTEGGYVGMLLLEKAMQRVGPDLTRERLRQALNSTCLVSGLTIQPKICFSPTSRFANLTMQGFTIQYRGTFGGWRAGPIVRDPGT